MTMAISIPDELVSKIYAAAKKEGFDKPEDFITRMLLEKLLELEEKEKIFEITGRVGRTLEAKGISEEETLADFEQFRERLHREEAKGSHRS